MSVFKIGDLVLYKNNQLIAFNKPVNIPVQEDKTGDKALLNLAEIYCKSTLYLVHRLDRPASGVLLFAKTKNALVAISEQFKTKNVRKTYLALVKNPPPDEEGTLVHYLKKNQQQNRTVLVEKDTPEAKEAVLQYKVINKSEHYYLLEIALITGRHHQIRAQLGAIGAPIKGDTKYGFQRSNADHSIHLHAWKLEFVHPVSQEKVEIIAPPPDESLWNTFKIM